MENRVYVAADAPSGEVGKRGIGPVSGGGAIFDLHAVEVIVAQQQVAPFCGTGRPSSDSGEHIVSFRIAVSILIRLPVLGLMRLKRMGGSVLAL